MSESPKNIELVARWQAIHARANKNRQKSEELTRRAHLAVERAKQARELFQTFLKRIADKKRLPELAAK